jgi:hypothetical protein
MPPTPTGPAVRHWGRRIAWLIAIWILGVAALGLVALSLKAIMRLVGLSA